ncbi:MAG: hypothetical protein D8M59_00080 [Planctomycetes bacterium]|nr:hypothetical protein [Planctomycetota bacterium]NOG56091.1 hypothetical protein [Planctomycetota bacterium]
MPDDTKKPKRHQPTAEEGKQALRDHIVEKAMNARLRYGLYIDYETITRMLDDREVVRYPTGIRFDAEPLQAGEFAFACQIGEHPRDGFCIFIHPAFEDQPDILPLLIAYHLVVINYGTLATSEDAELFGATLLGLEVDAYYEALCELADSLSA